MRKSHDRWLCTQSQVSKRSMRVGKVCVQKCGTSVHSGCAWFVTEAPTILNITEPLPEGPVPQLAAPTTSSCTKKKTKQSKVPKAKAHAQVTKPNPAEPACGLDSVAVDQNNTTAITKPNTTQKEPAMASSDSNVPGGSR